MRSVVASLVFALFAVAGAFAASPQDEQAFVDAYKQAFEAGDAEALHALSFADGAVPLAVKSFEAGLFSHMKRPVEIGLEELTDDDRALADLVQKMPDGSKATLMPRPYRKLVLKIEEKSSTATSVSSAEFFVGEQDGRLGISMLHPVE